ncbi:MAG: DUF1501 domain-containing protein [Planctomycetaceae bacterium]
MLTFRGKGVRLCDGLSRRELLRVGGLGSLGLTLPSLLRGRQAAAAVSSDASSSSTFGRAKHCILMFMWGGPPHQDTFDPKPGAPVESRGEFGAMATNVPGILLSDHLPRLARHADKYTIIRSVSHKNGEHIGVSHDILTGNVYRYINAVVSAARNDNPHYGAVLSHLKPRDNGMPPYVQIPCLLQSNSGKTIPGQNGGFLGQRFDPFMVEAAPNKGAVQDPQFRRFSPEELNLPAGLNESRLLQRQSLLSTFDAQRARIGQTAEQRGLDGLYQQAFSMLSSPRVRQAFDLSSAPAAQRDRYGRHTFGQGVFLARQLIEAGVPLVTVYWPNGPPRADIGWDNHVNNFRNLKNWQLPPVDRAFSALLEDLHQSGKLDETLVVWMGEFGRTPSINEQGGRDHWPQVYSIVMAGAGIPGGNVYGSSDAQAAEPASNPVSPTDVGATIYHYLGIASNTELTDVFTGQPHPVCRGTPIEGLT